MATTLLLLLLVVQACLPSSAVKQLHIDIMTGHLEGSADMVVQDELSYKNAEDRQKRQVFDFTNNVPRPNSNGTEGSDSEGTSPGPDEETDSGQASAGVTTAGMNTGANATTDVNDVSSTSTPSTTQDGTQGLGNEVNVTTIMPTAAPCFSLNWCQMGYQCENGGTCYYNSTVCTIHCFCPPPYNKIEFDNVPCDSLTSSPSTIEISTAVSCLNPCAFGEGCDNGGTCYFNETVCSKRCHCPAPYNDPTVYDQNSCKVLNPTTPTPSSPSSPSPTPTLRPLELRRCRNVVCYQGVCNPDETKPKCTCDKGWRGVLCEHQCSRVCANNGTCEREETTNREFCVCRVPWMGSNCTELPPDPPTHDKSLIYWLAGSFSVGFVLFLVLGSVFLFHLWRKRLVFALKLVYYFLPYEDNDGRNYDAFVSYVAADKDEQFVCQDLAPKLENEMGFTLCLHQRDFPIGAVISDCILDALEDSRRFVLILTPTYLKNEWAEFQFQRAFQEMLKRKLKIILVLLEEIDPSDSPNPTLKTILESVAIFEYPGSTADEKKLKKFWKRVELSMPKKKKEDVVLTNISSGNGEIVKSANGIGANNNILPPIDCSDDKMASSLPVIPNSSDRDKLCENGNLAAVGLQNSDYAVDLSHVVVETEQEKTCVE